LFYEAIQHELQQSTAWNDEQKKHQNNSAVSDILFQTAPNE
jgi:hypothetical protein